jgi:hypothetical protein
MINPDGKQKLIALTLGKPGRLLDLDQLPVMKRRDPFTIFPPPCKWLIFLSFFEFPRLPSWDRVACSAQNTPFQLGVGHSFQESAQTTDQRDGARPPPRWLALLSSGARR